MEDKRDGINSSSLSLPYFFLLNAFQYTGKDTFDREIREGTREFIINYCLYGTKPTETVDKEDTVQKFKKRKIQSRGEDEVETATETDCKHVIPNSEELQILTGGRTHQRIALADALKDIVHKELGLGDIPSNLFEKTKDSVTIPFNGETHTPRQWYKIVGSRERLKDPLVFVKKAISKWNGVSDVFITDWRLPNELEGLQNLLKGKAHVRTVRLYRPEKDVPHPDVSDPYEWAIANVPVDYILTTKRASKFSDACPPSYPFVKQPSLVLLWDFKNDVTHITRSQL